jgi:hypothetical protein
MEPPWIGSCHLLEVKKPGSPARDQIRCGDPPPDRDYTSGISNLEDKTKMRWNYRLQEKIGERAFKRTNSIINSINSIENITNTPTKNKDSKPDEQPMRMYESHLPLPITILPRSPLFSSIFTCP